MRCFTRSAGASKHVKVLENAGLVTRTVAGRKHVCRLDPQPLADVDEWVVFYRTFWTGRLDALEQRLRRETEGRETEGRETEGRETEGSHE
jgi:DNA-binding transcriptional ArsR family regulator